MSELKKVYDKPQMEVEEMEVQWAYLEDTTSGGSNDSGLSGDEEKSGAKCRS